MESNEQQNKSTRTFEEWKEALINIYIHKKEWVTDKEVSEITDNRVKPYYDQGLMPDVCYQELFNH